MGGHVSNEQREIIGTTTQILSVLSLCGSVFIVICYLKFRDLRNFAFKLVCFMSICDMCSSVAKLLGNPGGDDPITQTALCTFQALLLSFFELGSILWSAAIAFTLHMALLRRMPSFQSNVIGQQMYKYHVIIWTFVAVEVLLPLTQQAYGNTVGWCWIKNEKDVYHWRLIQFYIPLWIAVFYCMFVYIKVFFRLKESRDAGSSRLMTRIMYYPLVLVVCFGPATIHRLFEFFTQKTSFTLAMFHAVFSSVFGLSNAIVYGLTPVVRERVRDNLCCYSTNGSSLDDDPDNDVADV